MPKIIPEPELAAIIAIVGDHPDGVQVGPIRDRLTFSLPPRMLQRRLALLIEQKRLLAQGVGKGRRYHLPSGNVTITPQTGVIAVQVHPPLVEVYPPISWEGFAIRQAVRKPVQNGDPVGYTRSFLESYRPNITFYLPAETGQHPLDKGVRWIFNSQPEPMCGRSTIDS